MNSSLISARKLHKIIDSSVRDSIYGKEGLRGTKIRVFIRSSRISSLKEAILWEMASIVGPKSAFGVKTSYLKMKIQV